MSFFKKNLYNKNNLPFDIAYLNLNDFLIMPMVEKNINLLDSRLNTTIDYALKSSHRLVGTILTTKKNKIISEIGCASRITSFTEKNDGTYNITLKGVCRFYIDRIFKIKGNVQNITPVWCDFIDDLNIKNQKINNRNALLNIANDYFTLNKIETNKNLYKMTDAGIISLLNSLIEYNGFSKQKFLESKDLKAISKLCADFLNIEIALKESKESMKH